MSWRDARTGIVIRDGHFLYGPPLFGGIMETVKHSFLRALRAREQPFGDYSRSPDYGNKN